MTHQKGKKVTRQKKDDHTLKEEEKSIRALIPIAVTMKIAMKDQHQRAATKETNELKKIIYQFTM